MWVWELTERTTMFCFFGGEAVFCFSKGGSLELTYTVFIVEIIVYQVQ